MQNGEEQSAPPVPIIDPTACWGCGLCVRTCPTQALALTAGRAIVAVPEACDYAGICERICPAGAVRRPLEIIIPGWAIGPENTPTTLGSKEASDE